MEYHLISKQFTMDILGGRGERGIGRGGGGRGKGGGKGGAGGGQIK